MIKMKILSREFNRTLVVRCSHEIPVDVWVAVTDSAAIGEWVVNVVKLPQSMLGVPCYEVVTSFKKPDYTTTYSDRPTNVAKAIQQLQVALVAQMERHGYNRSSA